MTSIFQHTEKSPFHISVGAVLVNKEGKIAAHHSTRENIPERFSHLLGGLPEAYILMRESLEDNETLEAAVLRGIQEEFGAEGELVRYLGSIQIDLHAKIRTFEKTTLYFEVRARSLGERPKEDEESFTDLVWEDPQFLIEQMKKQGRTASREDLDESKILEAYMAYGN